jgi:hypothetical protein
MNEWRVESLRDLRAEGLSALYREGEGEGEGDFGSVYFIFD